MFCLKIRSFLGACYTLLRTGSRLQNFLSSVSKSCLKRILRLCVEKRVEDGDRLHACLWQSLKMSALISCRINGLPLFGILFGGRLLFKCSATCRFAQKVGCEATGLVFVELFKRLPQSNFALVT